VEYRFGNSNFAFLFRCPRFFALCDGSRKGVRETDVLMEVKINEQYTAL